MSSLPHSRSISHVIRKIASLRAFPSESVVTWVFLKIWNILPTVEFTIPTSYSCPRGIIMSAKKSCLICVSKSDVLADENPSIRSTETDISVREIGGVA